MFHRRKARVAVLAGTMLAVAGISGAAGAAIAAQPASDAPNARVAAVVEADATLVHDKHVIGVTRPRTGVYCVRTTISDLRRAIVLAGPWRYGRIVNANTTPHPECGNRVDTARVTVVDHNRAVVNDGFTIAVL